MKQFYTAGTALFLAWGCSPQIEEQSELVASKVMEFASEWTQAPLKCLEEPFHKLNFLSDQAKQWILPNGTKIDIPANAFSLGGKSYKGPVEMHYRNFNSAGEILRSGIPMAYEDGVLESAGMFEMRAFTPSGDVLDLASDKKVDIQMPSDKVDTNYMFYAFDENTGQWIEDGKPKTALTPEASSLLKEEALLTRIPKNTPFQLSEKDLKLETRSFLSYMYYPVNESDYPKMMTWLKKGLSPKLTVENEKQYMLRFAGDKKVEVYPVVSEAEKEAGLKALRASKMKAQQNSAFYINDDTYYQNANNTNVAMSFRSVQVSNMGIFNCDRLRNRGERKEMIFAQEGFDENTKAYLVFDKSGVQPVFLKGNSTQFTYDPKQLNEMFIVDDNKLYACKISGKKVNYELEKLCDIDEYFDADEFDAYVENY